MSVGTFTSLPYSEVAISHEHGGVGDLINDQPPVQGPEVQLPPGLVPRPDIWFAPGATFGNEGADVFRWEDFGFGGPSTPMRHGYLALGAFAEAVGATADWNGGVATLTGTNVDGQNVVLTVAQDTGNFTLTVDGTAVPVTDIASFAGQPQFAGRMMMVNRNDRVFVPLRFAASAFGYDVEMVGEAVRFFAR